MHSVDGNTVIASTVASWSPYSPSSGSHRHPPREEKEKQPLDDAEVRKSVKRHF